MSDSKTISPLKAVRLHCLWCCCGQSEEVRLCPVTDLYNYRFGHRAEEATKTALKAIKAKCLECSYGQSNEVKQCTFKDCNLYPFRRGKNPNLQGIGRENNFKGHSFSKNAPTINEITPQQQRGI